MTHMDTALLLFPDFALILLGAAIRRWMPLGDGFWGGVEKLVYFVFFPALLVHAILRTRLDLASAAPLLMAVAVSLAGGMLLAALPRPWVRATPLAIASVFQCGYRFNSYIALAVAGLLYGAPGVATMGLIVGAAVPLVNFISVWMLARHGEASVWREVVRNPLIWGTACGFVLNMAGFVAPRPLQAFMGRLSDAAIALGLIAVGAALRLGTQTAGEGLAPALRAYAAWLTAVKLCLLPLLASLIGGWLGLSGLNQAILILFAALPTASSAFILATRMGGDGASVAWLISATTLGAMLTLPVWASYLPSI